MSDSPQLDWIDDELEALSARGLTRRMRPIRGPQLATVEVDGARALNFSSNDYLGLAGHPALAAAATAALHEEGTGAGASRLIAGNHAAHTRLESALARFKQTPAALLFGSGYQANVGTLSALVGPGDAVFSDQLNHASIIDGCRLSRAEVRVYPHLDLAALARMLAAATGARRRLIVTESVFSMDGDLAPLAAIADLAAQHQAMWMVDEAHATGVLGPAGRGYAAAVGVTPDIQMGTLGKALGVAGAYVAGSASLIQLLVHKARSFVFTTAAPPSVAAAALAALELAAGPVGDERRTQLFSHVRQFREGLDRLGIAPSGPASHIIPILMGDSRRTMEASERLLAAGVFAQGIRPPTVPEGTARLRFTLMATHGAADLDRALAALGNLHG